MGDTAQGALALLALCNADPGKPFHASPASLVNLPDASSLTTDVVGLPDGTFVGEGVRVTPAIAGPDGSIRDGDSYMHRTVQERCAMQLVMSQK